MSFLDRIAECNDHDPSRYVPFDLGGARVGRIRRDRLPVLRDLSAPVDVSTDRVVLRAAADFAARSTALAATVDALVAAGELRRVLGERYAVRARLGGPPLASIDRAALPWLGLQALGVHLNGYVRRNDGLHMWIARRARDKGSYPGMLDNMVAGGQPIDLGLVENVVKEAGEEAGIPTALARRAVAVGAVTYCHEAASGLKPDCMFCFDLELPETFTPHPADGEVEAFYLWPIERAAAVVRDTREFKFNSNLVVIDFLVRHGVLPPDDADYVDVVRGLRAPC